MSTMGKKQLDENFDDDLFYSLEEQQLDQHSDEKEPTDSQRVPKGRFNIFKVACLNSRPNYFIGSLIVFLILGLICPLIAVIWIDTLGFLLIMLLPAFGMLGVGIKFFFNALTTYRFGRQYLGEIAPISLECKIVINGRELKLSTTEAHRLLLNDRCLTVYDETNDSFLFVSSNKRFVSNNSDNVDVFAKEDQEIQKRIDKKERKKSRDLRAKKDEIDSLKYVVASDNKNASSMMSIIVLSAIITLIASVLFLLYFVFGVDKNLFIALSVVGGVMSALCLFGIIICFFSYQYLRRLLRGAELIYSKKIGTGHVTESHESDTGNWHTKSYFVEYEIMINDSLVQRKSYHIYSKEAIAKIKRMKYYPILFNEKMNDALYFKMEHCLFLNREKTKKSKTARGD